MGRRRVSEDPKVAALREARCLNPHPEAVRDEAFLSQEFFDARDVVQVKYEMVRRVKADGVSVTEAAAAFGYSRPSYYQAAAALEQAGLDGLVPGKPGPRRGHKLTAEILAWVEDRLLAEPGLRPAALVEAISERFGVRVHPRSIERAMTRYREQRSKSR
jgi:transposase